MLARAMGKDDRTTKKALTELKKKNLINETEEGYFIGIQERKKKARGEKQQGGGDEQDKHIDLEKYLNDAKRKR